MNIEHLRKRHPEHIFIIVTSRADNVKLTKTKFMVNMDISFGLFINTLRKYIDSSQTIIGFIGNHIPKSTDSIGKLYTMYRGNDGILYITIMTETVFGA
jgi:hypothetical protein